MLKKYRWEEGLEFCDEWEEDKREERYFNDFGDEIRW